MKIALFIIGLFCLASLTNAGTFLEAKIRHTSRSLTPEKFASNLKHTEFGKSLFNLLALQFRTSGKLDDVNTLLIDLKSKITQQQDDDNDMYTQTTAANNQIIQDQTAVIANAEQTIQDSQSRVNQDQDELASLIDKQTSLQTNEQNLQNQIDSYTSIRATQSAAFKVRVDGQNKLLAGIEDTVQVLQDKLEDNPQNADGINNIIGLLQQISAAFTASIEQDTEQDAQEDQNLQDFVAASKALITQIDSQLDEITARVSDLNTEIAQLKIVISDQQTAEDNAQTLKDNTIAAQQSLDAKYNSNKATRANQVAQLDQTIGVLSQNSQDVQSYLNQA